MMKLYIYVLFLSSLAVLQACGPKFEAQEPCGFVQNSNGERVALKHNSPMVMYIHESVIKANPDAKAVIIKSMQKWNDAAGKELLVLGGEVGGVLQPREDGVSVIYWMETWEINRDLEQARTTIYFPPGGDQIREADIRVNGSYKKSTSATLFNFSMSDQSVKGAVDFESLMIHELGHVVGLAHRDDKDTVMATTLANATLRRELSQSDLESLRCEY